MSVFAGSFAVSSIDQYEITDIPFLPSGVELTCSAIAANNETDTLRYSSGFASDNFNSADSIFKNANAEVTRSFRDANNKCLVVYATPGATLTRVLTIQHIEFVTELGVNKWKFDVVEYNSNYAFSISARFIE